MTDDVDFRRGPLRSPHYEENLEWWTTAREESMTVGCSDCHAPKGQPCRNAVTGEPLKKFPAHASRSEAARKQGAQA